MPYIEQYRREDAATNPLTTGELTFALQQLLKNYLDRSGRCYGAYAECLGALDGARLDLWDRQIQPYERMKCADNGDVW